MPSIPDLPRTIDTLARLDAEGWLDDYLHAVADATRGPRGDVDRWPHHRYQVGRFARMASTLFGVSIADAHMIAALAALSTPAGRVSACKDPDASQGLCGRVGGEGLHRPTVIEACNSPRPAGQAGGSGSDVTTVAIKPTVSPRPAPAAAQPNAMAITDELRSSRAFSRSKGE